jgi:hypothetical protein
MGAIGITFEIKKRVNSYAPNGEWVLQGKYEEESPWIFYTWKKEPSGKEILRIQNIIERSFSFYHLVLTESLRKIKS